MPSSVSFANNNDDVFGSCIFSVWLVQRREERIHILRLPRRQCARDRPLFWWYCVDGSVTQMCYHRFICSLISETSVTHSQQVPEHSTIWKISEANDLCVLLDSMIKISHPETPSFVCCTHPGGAACWLSQVYTWSSCHLCFQECTKEGLSHGSSVNKGDRFWWILSHLTVNGVAFSPRPRSLKNMEMSEAICHLRNHLACPPEAVWCSEQNTSALLVFFQLFRPVGMVLRAMWWLDGSSWSLQRVLSRNPGLRYHTTCVSAQAGTGLRHYGCLETAITSSPQFPFSFKY